MSKSKENQSSKLVHKFLQVFELETKTRQDPKMIKELKKVAPNLEKYLFPQKVQGEFLQRN